MLEREVNPNVTEVPEMPQVLSSILLYVTNEAQERFDRDGDFVPFTAIAIGDKIVLENVEAGSPEDMYAWAKHTVENVRGADAYALCYDGYLKTDQGRRDVIIAEGGVPGAVQGEAVGLVYDTKEDGTREYHKPTAYIGKAPNFMIFTNDEPHAGVSFDDPDAEVASEPHTESDAIQGELPTT